MEQKTAFVGFKEEGSRKGAKLRFATTKPLCIPPGRGNKAKLRFATRLSVGCFCGVLALMLVCLKSALMAVGTQGGEFLRIEGPARQMGLGGAFTGLADDVNALLWNPAGIATLKKAEVGGTYIPMPADVYYGFLGFTKSNFGSEKIAIGLGVRTLYTNVNATDYQGVDRGDFVVSQISYGLSFSYSRYKPLLLGTTFKGITSQYGSYNDAAFTMDFGAFYTMQNFSGVTVGGSVLNTFGELKMVDEADDLATVYKFGVAKKFTSPSLTLLVDLENEKDGQTTQSFGAEYNLFPQFTLRMGYHTGVDAGGLAFGFGVKSKKDKLGIDYAFTPLKYLADTHRISFVTRF